MRIGINPEKENKEIKDKIYHRVVVTVYIPDFEGYFAGAFKVFKLCLESLLLTVHSQTRITIYNNNCHKDVKIYIDKKYYESEYIDQVFHSKKNVGKINAILASVKGNLEKLITVTDADVLGNNPIYENNKVVLTEKRATLVKKVLDDDVYSIILRRGMPPALTAQYLNITDSLSTAVLTPISNVYKNEKYFDFGISNENQGKQVNESLHYWKESFGARTIVQNFYEIEVKKRLVPLIKISAINRFLMNRVGDRGFKMVARYWMRDQKRKEDGLRFLKWVYQPGIIRKSLWPIVKMGMLRKKTLADGRIVYRMPYRKSLKHDLWEPTDKALEVGAQWNLVRKGGGKLSFTESDVKN